MTSRCPKCSGYLISEIVWAESDWIIETHCVNCAWYLCPKENYQMRVINRVCYNADETMRYRRMRTKRPTYGGTPRY